MSIAAYLSNLLNSSGLIVGSKIASNTIGLSNLSATGTPSASNFLRGDNTWAAAGAGTVTSITAGTGLSGGTITTSGTIALVTTASAVGTNAYLYYAAGTSGFSMGTSVAGSNLRAGGAYVTAGCSPSLVMTTNGAIQSGTWQSMGGVANNTSGGSTNFIRIA